MLQDVAKHLRADVEEAAGQFGLPGYLAGVYHGGEEVVVAHGLANVATGEAMTEDTGFLLGSITKVLTTTLVMKYVERGQMDLDERVVTYLPEFKLAPPAQAEEIRIRNLFNHTNGIDADLMFPGPNVKGRDALKVYVEDLATCGTLFDPEECVSYSNPAFMVAARALEVVTGECFHDLLEREIYDAVGMADSCTSAEQAILRSTAVGHFNDWSSGEVRRTDYFMLPGSGSAAGGTPIVTIPNMLAFGRMHLNDGMAISGTRVLSAETTRRMRTVTHDMGTPNIPPIGLGWWLFPFGDTTVLWHTGASPGGQSSMIVIPDHDLVFVAYGNAGAGAMLHGRLQMWLLTDYLGLDVPEFAVSTVEATDLGQYEGTYRSNQLRWEVEAVDGELQQVAVYEPLEEGEHAAVLQKFLGGGGYPGSGHPQRIEAVGDGLFAPAGAPLESFSGFNRLGLLSFHGRTNGKATYRSQGLRVARRQR